MTCGKEKLSKWRCNKRKGKKMVRKRNRNGTELLRRQMDMFREGGFGSESQSRPEEISEKLISIQTDTVGCRGARAGASVGLE